VKYRRTACQKCTSWLKIIQIELHVHGMDNFKHIVALYDHHSVNNSNNLVVFYELT
jgi:hypothetical protein